MVMEQYLINDTTLSAIGDVIRQAKGEEKYLFVYKYSHTPNIDDEGNVSGEYASGLNFADVITIPGASSLKVTLTYQTQPMGGYGDVCVWEGNHPEYRVQSDSDKSISGILYTNESKTKEYIIQGDSVTFGFYSNILGGTYGYYAVVEAPGTEENPDTHYLPSEIPQEISNIAKYTLPSQGYIFSGNCSNKFYVDAWNWYIDYFGDLITTKDITTINSMFYGSKELKRIPFELNVKPNVAGTALSSIFYECRALKELPKINNAVPSDTSSIFYRCYNLREIPFEFYENWDWSYMDKQTSAYYCNRGKMFYECHSLRKVPLEFLIHDNPKKTSSSYSMYSGGFLSCTALDEIVNLPIPYTATWTSNNFSDFVNYCSRLKNLTFALQEDGTPYVMKWKSQTIDLSKYIGYVMSNSTDSLLKYNSGITTDTQVTDDATYQALKDDPDWWTTQSAYSRYNHDSAVATINSLPDTSAYLASAGGTNTIKFTGAAGSATDGGAINTLTEEEIAVATAKGWTVSLA